MSFNNTEGLLLLLLLLLLLVQLLLPSLESSLLTSDCSKCDEEDASADTRVCAIGRRVTCSECAATCVETSGDERMSWTESSKKSSSCAGESSFP